MMKLPVDEAIARYSLLSNAKTVLCALSGGADSVAMTHFLAKNAQRFGVTVKAAHFSHGIRKEAQEPERELCKRLCDSLGIELFCGIGDSIAFSKEQKTGVENAARILRYDFLQKTAQKLDSAVIATAHHAFDNAETVIMNMIRGAKIAGLSGIPPKRDGIIRPLILSSREEIDEYIEENHLEYATDKTNFEPCCRRNAIRLRVLPELLREDPAAVKNICRLSELCREENAKITEKAEIIAQMAKCEAGAVSIPAKVLLVAERDAAVRAIQLLYKKSGGKAMLTSAHFCAVLSLCENQNPSANADLPEISVHREYENLVFGGETPEEIKTVYLHENETVRTGNYEITCKNGSEKGFTFAKSKISFPLTIRKREPGDSIFYAGHTRSVKKLLIDKKIPLKMRDSLPILCNNDKAVAVFGIGCDKTLAPASDEACVTVMIRRV